MIRHPPLRRQDGVALLTVLLLVAVMTVLVIGMLDDIRFGIRRTSNIQAVTQAQLHAMGADAVARQQIQQISSLTPGRTTLEGDWNNRPFIFPIDQGEGGSATVRLFDASNCFNLNSVVEGTSGQWQRRELGVRQYIALMHALDVPDAQARQLADALVDWIDSDSVPSPAGAEDSYYASLRPMWRTGATLLAEASELHAVAGYTPTVYARLRPFVCALPGNELSPLNINTLLVRDAPLVSMLTLGALDASQSRQIIESRPAQGWTDQAVFWSQPAMAHAAVPDPVLQQTELRTRFFGLHAEIEYGDAEVVLSELLEHKDGAVVLRARRWTNDE